MEGIQYRTGNDTVDRLSRMNITGNIIPATWYQTIRKTTGKPYLNAIVILSDIVYWYRATEIRDEGSGQLIGYRKRFKADLLQRSYQQMANQFGITKRDATNAVVELERLGVIKRIFRTLTINGQLIPNVLFLALNADVLQRLTFPRDHAENGIEDKTRLEKGVEEKTGQEVQIQKDPEKRYHQNRGYHPPEIERGITELEDITHSNKGEDPTQMGETNTENTYRDYKRAYPIQSYREVKEVFKKQIEYSILKIDRVEADELDELVEIAVEVLTSSADTIRVNREERSAELVREQYRKLNMFHIQYVLDCLKTTETKARNIRAVMITALYNAGSTMESYYGNLYQYQSGKKEKTDFSRKPSI